MSEVRSVFYGLLAGDVSRDAADRWAFERINALEHETLCFEPAADADLIWSALEYLHGIDLQEEPGRYLHSLDDIKSRFEQRWREGSPIWQSPV